MPGARGIIGGDYNPEKPSSGASGPQVPGLAGFGWANLRIYEKHQKQLRATRISVEFRDGWYALTAHNVASPTTGSAHFRLRLTAANRDNRNTTLSFLGLRVPGHTALVINQAKLYPEGMVPRTLMSAVDINAGQTLPTIVEVHLTFPSNDPTPWGPTVGVQIDFGETFTTGPITFSADVPTTP